MAERDRPTSAAADADEGFLRRWSRRKAKARSGPVVTDAVATEAPSPDATVPVPLQGAHEQDAPPVGPDDLPDIESLDATSDFTAFLRPGVPAHLRTAALRKLWRSDPIFSKLDGLVEYGEDYTISSWPKGAIKTAYRIGRGFVNELETLEAKAERAPPEPPAADPAPELAPVLASSAEEPAAEIVAVPPEPAPPAPVSNEVRPELQPASRSTGTTAPSKHPPRRRLPRRG